MMNYAPPSLGGVRELFASREGVKLKFSFLKLLRSPVGGGLKLYKTKKSKPYASWRAECNVAWPSVFEKTLLLKIDRNCCYRSESWLCRSHNEKVKPLRVLLFLFLKDVSSIAWTYFSKQKKSQSIRFGSFSFICTPFQTKYERTP